MKTISKILAVALLLIAATTLEAARSTYNTTFANEAGLAYSNTYVLDTSNLALDQLSWQAVYGTATFSNAAFTDGVVSTGSITVVSTQPLVGLAGSNTITLRSNTLPSTAKITIRGYDIFGGGADWAVQSLSSNTAVSIKNGINAHSSYLGVTASTTSATVVTLKCNTVGSLCNSYPLAVNTSSMTVGSAKFTGGVDHAYFCVNGTCLTEGTDWTVGANTSATANSISDAIVASSLLNSVVSSTYTANVVSSTSTAVGTATRYSLKCRPQSALACFATAYRNGSNTSVATSGGRLYIPAHGFTKALPVLFRTTAGTPPQDLIGETTYYVVSVDPNYFKLATTSAKAQAGTADVRLSTQTATGGGSFQLKPLAFSGTPSFKWQASNDSTNWADLSVSSVTFSSPYTASNTAWDFGAPNYTYYRLNVVGPSQGGMKLVVTGNGRSNRAYRP